MIESFRAFIGNNQMMAYLVMIESSDPKLKLLSMRDDVSGSGMFHTVEGEVQNISGTRLEAVNVVVTFYDANDQLVTSNSSFLEYNPIMPNQTSPFKVMIRDNPAMDTYRVDFKFFAGESIDYVDARPPKPQRKPKKK